jgi:N-acyl-D-aspartate/D-glutamate deacylase
MLNLPVAERVRRMRDPVFRAQVLSEAPSAELLNRLSQFRQKITTSWKRMFPMQDPPNYEPEEKDSIASIAARSNHSPDEIAYDYLAGGADRFLFFPIVGYNEDNLDIIHEMLSDETTLLGLSDGGAHCSSIVDASVPSWMLIHWARDRTRGPKLPLEMLVRRQTHDTARFFGFHDRGLLREGLKADVNVIDYQNLRLHVPEVRYDLPMNGRRLLQRVDGYKYTFVSGVSTFEHGVYTGATAGRLVRAG